jgi:hypothetical protein
MLWVVADRPGGAASGRSESAGLSRRLLAAGRAAGRDDPTDEHERDDSGGADLDAVLAQLALGDAGADLPDDPA